MDIINNVYAKSDGTRLSPIALALVLGLALVLAGNAIAQGGPAERRQEVVAAAARGVESIPVLQKALEDENPLVRRAAMRALVEFGEPAKDIVAGALDNEDLVVRRAALMALAGDAAPQAVPYMARAMNDSHPSMRQVAASLLAVVEPRTEEIIELLQRAEKDEASEVQLVAITALAKSDPEARPFHVQPRDTVLLRDRPDMADHITRITAVESIRLPKDGWRLRLDPARQGHSQNWFAEELDVSEWSKGSIEMPWVTGYVGVGWYRLEIDLPERPDHLAAELHFEGVDESAWVWVNGVYVGGQDIGPSGWDQPFRVDVTEELRWNGRNQITVRVMNTAHAGGIWRPVTLEALALK